MRDNRLVLLTVEDVETIVISALHSVFDYRERQQSKEARPAQQQPSNSTAKIKTYTSREVESLFNISKTTRRAWERKGLLRAVSIGGRKKVFKGEEVEALLNQKTNAL
jgi:hypothetical protein